MILILNKKYLHIYIDYKVIGSYAVYHRVLPQCYNNILRVSRSTLSTKYEK